jgi:hypothetical protein
MGWLWLAVSIVAIGLAALIVAPMAQSCTTDIDTRVCETGGTIVLNVVGGVLVVLGGLWSGLLWSRRRGATN